MEINIIDKNMNLDDLEGISKKYEIPLDKSNNTILWCLFGIYYGINNNLTESESLSFGYIVSKLITHKEYDLGTSKYFNERKLIADILNKYHENDLNGLDDNSKLKLLFYQIYEFYCNDLEMYSYKTERICVRLTISDKEKLMTIDGKNQTDKVHNLIRNFK